MTLPSTSREAMLEAIRQFQVGARSPQGPYVGDDWLSKANHKYAIVHEGAPYPLKEIIRLAIRIDTGSDAPRFTGGTGDAMRYAEQYHLTVVPKHEWMQAAQNA